MGDRAQVRQLQAELEEAYDRIAEVCADLAIGHCTWLTVWIMAPGGHVLRNTFFCSLKSHRVWMSIEKELKHRRPELFDWKMRIHVSPGRTRGFVTSLML